MPRMNHRRGDHPARRRDNTDYHVKHQAEVAAAGGWYLWHRQQRIQREQANMKEGLNSAKAATIYQEEAQKVP